MKESAIVTEWKAEGKAEGKVEGQRESLLQFLELRFSGEISGDLVAAIEAESDRGRLRQGIAAVAKSTSIEEFRALAGL
jgi:hypothetical protein